jgi:hypothetical protein
MNAEALYLQRLLVLAVCAARPVSRRRAYGTGSLFTEPRADGRESWYGQFRVGGRLVKRALGPKRGQRSPDGLTRTQAERKLRQLIEATRPLPPERLTVAEAGARLVAHLAELGRKRSTLAVYESCLRVHLVPFFRQRPLHRITRGPGRGVRRPQDARRARAEVGPELPRRPALDLRVRRTAWSRRGKRLQAG